MKTPVVPLTFAEQAKTNRSLNSLLVLGRLKAGVDSTQADAEMATIAQRLAAEFPDTNADRSVAIAPLAQMTEEVTDRFVVVLSAAAMFLLLLAAANVANIQLARATNRERDIAIESALGASGDPRPNIRAVDARYFKTMEIPMIQGREITDQDSAGSMPAAVVNRSFAEHYRPGGDAIGRRIRVGVSGWITIVGIAGGTKEWFTSAPQPMMYVPYRQVPLRSMRLLVKTANDPLLAVNDVRARIRQIDPTEPIYEIKTVGQMMSEERSGVEASARIISANASIGGRKRSASAWLLAPPERTS